MVGLRSNVLAVWRAVRQHPVVSSFAGVLSLATLFNLDQVYSLGERANTIMTALAGPGWLVRMASSPHFRLFFAICALSLLWRIGILVREADKNAEVRQRDAENAATKAARDAENAATKAARDAEVAETERRAAIFRPALLMERRESLRYDVAEFKKHIENIRMQVDSLHERVEQLSDGEHHVGHMFNNSAFRLFLPQWTFRYMTHPPPFPKIDDPPAHTHPVAPDRPSFGLVFSSAENGPFFRIHAHNHSLMQAWLGEAERHLEAQEGEIQNLTQEIWSYARNA